MKLRNKTFAQLYEQTLAEVYTAYDFIVKPRGMEIKEIQNLVLELTNPYSNLFTNQVRSVPLKYLCGELYWYFTGNRTTEFISKYAKFWEEISSKDGFGREIANSAYGYMLFERGKPFFTEWSWALQSLQQDEDTRQAIMHFNTPQYMKRNVKDFPCTMDGVFQIRNHRLSFTVHMRSQDVIKGLTYDLPFFSMLQQNMLILLNSGRDKFSQLTMGSLTLFVNSEHLYQSDYELARKMLLTEYPTFKESTLPPMRQPLFTEGENYYLLSPQLRPKDELVDFILTHAELKEKSE